MDEKKIADEFIENFMVGDHKYDILFEKDTVIALMVAFKQLRLED